MVSFPHKIRILTKKKEAKKKYQQQSQYFYKIALHKSKGQKEEAPDGRLPPKS
jgi:hypothetical protein